MAAEDAALRVQMRMELARLHKELGATMIYVTHDQVEATLMRRAGFGVWIAYDLPGSYEELPPTLLDAMKRDRRWCQGNLQHLRLLFAEGLFDAISCKSGEANREQKNVQKSRHVETCASKKDEQS